jgi:ribonuclease-3
VTARDDGENAPDPSSTREEFTTLERAIGHEFEDIGLLERALVHSSHSGESTDSDNETFEVLGDAVIDLVLSELMMREHPDFDEGILTRQRASLVNATNLAAVARTLGLGEWIRLGRGEQRSGGRDKDSILASCYEALVGAVFLDAGYESCRAVVGRHFCRRGQILFRPAR